MANFKMSWKGDALGKKILGAAIKGMEGAGAEWQHDSEELCPKDKGYDGGLVSTALLEIDSKEAKATLSYHKVYARRQHYDMTYRHKSGETAYYLLNPLFYNGFRYLEHVGANIRKSISR